VDFGQQVQITAIVSAIQPGAGTITGTIVFSVNTIPVYTVTLDGTTLSATYSTNTLPIGTNTVCAQYLYGTNPNFNNSLPTCVAITVNKAQTKTSLTSAPNPSNFGQMAVFTATVIPAGVSTSTITPTGTVTFTFNSTGYMTGTLTQGVATVVTNTLPAGTYNVTADYGGDGNFLSSSATWSHTVNQNPTTTTLTLSPPGSAGVGTLVTFTAIVSSTGGVTPTGTVKFWDGVTVIGTGALNVSGVATFSTSALAAGSHSLKASYDGTPNFSPSSSARQTYTITAVGSATSLTSTPNASNYGQLVTFTATVTRTDTSAPIASVVVEFKEGGTTLGSGTTNGAGVATFSTSSLAAGTHPIVAVFAGNASFGGSTSNTVNQVVNKVTPTVTVTDNPDPTVYGEAVTLVATVAPVSGGATPTGIVSFTVGATVLGTVALNGAGQATLVTSAIPAGTNQTITANYSGDNNYTSASATTTHTVNKAHTKTTVTSSPPSSLTDQEVTIIATVTVSETVVTPGAGTPGGTVEFKVASTSIGSKSLVNGSASITHTFTVTGTFTIEAFYTNSDGNFENSDGSTTHNVNAAPADLSVTKADSPDPVNVGDDLTYVINVTNNETDPVNVTLTDTLPPQVSFVSASGGCTHDGSALGGVVTCDLGSLAGGGSASVTIVVNVPIATPAGTVLRNTAQANGAQSDTEETTVYRSPRRGDCNGDDAVDLADIWSIVRDIFDPTFQGTSGCDANQDRRVDAGDVPSTVLIMFNGARSQGRRGADSLVPCSLVPFSPAPLLLCSSAPLPGPALTMPEEVQAVAGQAVVPVTFAANGHSITSLAFSVDYDETWLSLNPADRDGNGVPDAVVFSLPGDFTYSVTFDEGDADGEVDVFIGDITPPLTSLSDGPIVFTILNVDSSPGATRGAVRFSLDPAASFGDTSGQSVPGTATPTTRQYQIYLPVAFR
jgi:uncharacterized repeat protein (TIGR01451 family)